MSDKKRFKDPEEKLIKELIAAAPNEHPYADDPMVWEAWSKFLKYYGHRFPVIRSADDPCAGLEAIRMRMKYAAKVLKSRLGYPFIEVSIQDMLKHGCIVHGRNFMLPECGIGVHDIAHPKYGANGGKVFSEKEREENRKKCCRLIGCNRNGSGTAKALCAATCLRLGVRCILSVGDLMIVDNWPDYCVDRAKLNENHCVFSVS